MSLIITNSNQIYTQLNVIIGENYA